MATKISDPQKKKKKQLELLYKKVWQVQWKP